jgi:4-amino-4-deoxy-L-arabinose transferase-like glycosyltransferase
MSLRFSLFLFFIEFVIKIIAIFNTNFDLFGDEAQYWILSQNLDFGYFSKPPLLMWLVGCFTMLFGNSFVLIKTIPLLLYLCTSYIIFLLSYELYNNKNLSVLAAISFYLIPAVSVSSFLLSTDIILILFWSLCLLFLLKIRKNPAIINFFLLGIFLGLSFLAKYAAIYFLLSLVVIICFDKNIREIFYKKFLNVVIFLTSAFIILLPNILWNIKNNWLTISHTSDNAALNKININLLQGFEFILIQALMMGLVLFLFFLITIKKIKINFETKFLLSFSLPIFFIVLIESILVRANANWAAVAIVSFFILLFNHAYNYTKKTLIANNIVNFIFCVVFFILISINLPLKIFDRINGISTFASLIKEKHMGNNRVLVIEDRLLYSNLRYLYRNSNFILLTPHDPKKEIKGHFDLSSPLNPSFNKNFIFLGNPNQLNYLIKTKKTVFKKRPIYVYEVVF